MFKMWINNRPLEYYIKGKAGESLCCDVCGSSKCRTIQVDGKIYEAIPYEVIVKAGLVAASKLIGTKKGKSCC